MVVRQGRETWYVVSNRISDRCVRFRCLLRFMSFASSLYFGRCRSVFTELDRVIRCYDGCETCIYVVCYF
jgi:hypothetical protein